MIPMNFRRHAAAMLIAGGLVAAIGFAIAPFNVGQAAAASTPAGPAGIRDTAWVGAFGHSGTGEMRGCHDHEGMSGQGTSDERCVMLRVTSVSGTDISATTWDNRPVTVTVSGSTQYHQDDMNASLSDVHAGSMIYVRGSLVGHDTIAATHVAIILPRVGGVVMAVNGTRLTVTGFDGSSNTIVVSPQTHYERAGHPATAADVKVGTAIVAEGTRNSDGSLNAVAVMIQVPRVIGRVTSINGTSLTVSGLGGITYTVTTSSSTLYVAPGSTAAPGGTPTPTPTSAASIHVGSFIVAQGTFGANRQTLEALRIIVLPASDMHHMYGDEA